MLFSLSNGDLLFAGGFTDEPLFDLTQLAAPDFLTQPMPMPKTARVLVVEDCTLTQHVITSLLKELTANVEQAFDGAQAILSCNTTTFDVIFMDIHMPKVNGLEATHHIRSTSNRNAITPIIAFTSTGRLEGRCGMLVGFWGKPRQCSTCWHGVVWGMGIDMPCYGAVTLDADYTMFGVNDLLKKPFTTDSLSAIFDKWTPYTKELNHRERHPHSVLHSSSWSPCAGRSRRREIALFAAARSLAL